MYAQFEVISYRPSYNGGWVITWKCRNCGQSGEDLKDSPGGHKCPPKPHQHEVE